MFLLSDALKMLYGVGASWVFGLFYCFHRLTKAKSMNKKYFTTSCHVTDFYWVMAISFRSIFNAKHRRSDTRLICITNRKLGRTYNDRDSSWLLVANRVSKTPPLSPFSLRYQHKSVEKLERVKSFGGTLKSSTAANVNRKSLENNRREHKSDERQ